MILTLHCLRLCVPAQVVGEIIAGVILGPSVMGLIPGFSDTIFPDSSKEFLTLFSSVGLCFFMLFLGLEVDPSFMIQSWRTTLPIAAISMSIPFGVGVGVATWLFTLEPESQYNRICFLLFIGTVFSFSAFPVLARILDSTQLISSPVGIQALGLAALEDVAAWCLLALIISYSTVGPDSNPTVPGDPTTRSPWNAVLIFLVLVAFIAVLMLIARPLINRAYIRKQENREDLNEFIPMLLFGFLISAWFTETLGIVSGRRRTRALGQMPSMTGEPCCRPCSLTLSFVTVCSCVCFSSQHAFFGSFLFGCILPKEGELIPILAPRIELLIVNVFLPIYFANSGMKTQLQRLDSVVIWAYAIVVIIVASVSKITSVTLASKLVLSIRERRIQDHLAAHAWEDSDDDEDDVEPVTIAKSLPAPPVAAARSSAHSLAHSIANIDFSEDESENEGDDADDENVGGLGGTPEVEESVIFEVVTRRAAPSLAQPRPPQPPPGSRARSGVATPAVPPSRSHLNRTHAIPDAPACVTVSAEDRDEFGLDIRTGLPVVSTDVGLIRSFAMASWTHCLTLGVLLNSRGLVTLIVLNVGLDKAIIGPRIFSLMLVMSIVCTCLTSPIVHALYAKRWQQALGQIRAMDLAEAVREEEVGALDLAAAMAATASGATFLPTGHEFIEQDLYRDQLAAMLEENRRANAAVAAAAWGDTIEVEESEANGTAAAAVAAAGTDANQLNAPLLESPPAVSDASVVSEVSIPVSVGTPRLRSKGRAATTMLGSSFGGGNQSGSYVPPSLLARLRVNTSADASMGTSPDVNVNTAGQTLGIGAARGAPTSAVRGFGSPHLAGAAAPVQVPTMAALGSSPMAMPVGSLRRGGAGVFMLGSSPAAGGGPGAGARSISTRNLFATAGTSFRHLNSTMPAAAAATIAAAANAAAASSSSRAGSRAGSGWNTPRGTSSPRPFAAVGTPSRHGGSSRRFGAYATLGASPSSNHGAITRHARGLSFSTNYLQSQQQAPVQTPVTASAVSAAATVATLPPTASPITPQFPVTTPVDVTPNPALDVLPSSDLLLAPSPDTAHAETSQIALARCQTRAATPQQQADESVANDKTE